MTKSGADFWSYGVPNFLFACLSITYIFVTITYCLVQEILLRTRNIQKNPYGKITEARNCQELHAEFLPLHAIYRLHGAVLQSLRLLKLLYTLLGPKTSGYKKKACTRQCLKPGRSESDREPCAIPVCSSV